MGAEMKALIIARGCSERVKNKNLRPFAGTSLLVNKINQLKKVPELDGIVVNSESESILAIARLNGAETRMRPGKYARGDCPMSEVYKNVAESMDCESILFANCTAPLVTTETYSDLIESWDDRSFDSLNSVSIVKDFLWDLKHFKPLNYNPENQPRSQDLEGIVRIDWCAAVVRRDAMIKQGRVVCRHFGMYLTPDDESIDIDTEADFLVAEILFKTRQQP